eukprot:Skav224810  [mRNA]  locus=scaffold631:11636:12613:+ [translate_table: standard]
MDPHRKLSDQDWPEIPPSPMEKLEHAPSLEFCDEPDVRDLLQESLMQVMQQHHDSLAKHLQMLDSRIQ